MIVTDKNLLTSKCEPCETIKEGEEIATKLLKELTKSQSGIGLAANQIGINKRVCVINVIEPVILINPRIMEVKEKTYTIEGCLSFPGKQVRTERFKHITIESDNLGVVSFGPTGSIDTKYSDKQQLQLLESICVRHEIDHLDGITMYERTYKRQPVVREGKKIGRNDKVLIACGVDSKVMKYKKALPLLEKGWTLVEQ